MLTGNDLLEPLTEQKEPTFTKEDLDLLWTTLEYTRATIENYFESEEDKWIIINKLRAHQSLAYLEQALKTVNQMKGEFH